MSGESKFYNSFIALDVETANSNRSSICQIGMAAFENGEVVRIWDWLINPNQKFNKWNIRLHGIDNEAVTNAPDFSQIYDELRSTIENQIVVSHSSFDPSAISAATEYYNLSTIEFIWLDSLKIAQEAWPESLSFKLKHLAFDLDIEFNHHDAHEDALVSGKILLSAIRDTGIPIEGWIKFMNIYVSTANVRPESVNKQLPPKHKRQPCPTVNKHKSIVFTGNLSISRQKASDLAVAAGFRVVSSVSSRTNFVVVGNGAGNKLSVACDLIKRGHDIKFLREDDFINIVT